MGEALLLSLHGHQVLGKDSFAVARDLEEELVHFPVVVVAAILSDLEGRGQALNTSYLVGVFLWDRGVYAAHAYCYRRLIYHHAAHLHIGILAFPTFSTRKQQAS